jgi:hypothetical protein
VNLNLQNDYLTWDDLEPVTFTSHGLAPSKDIACPIAQALRRNPTYKELAAANGAYTAQDVVWLLPSALLNILGNPANPSPQPKPGDVTQDSAGVKWTVLEVSLDAVSSVWRLMTRNLVIAYQLRDLIDIQQSGQSYDDDAAVVRVWPPNGQATVLASNLPARVQPADATIGYGRGIRGQDIKLDVFLSRQLLGFDVRECRIKWTDVGGFAGPVNTVYFLDLEHYHDAQRIDELPKIDALLKK